MSTTIKFVIFSFLAIFLMSTQCRKEPPIVYQYKFLEKIDLYPFQKSYHVGDTLWIQYSNLDSKFFDQITRQRIFSDTISLPFQFGYNSRYQAPVNPVGGFFDFKAMNVVVLDTHFEPNGESLFTSTNCSNTYNFKIGIVSKYSGIYSLDFWGVPRTVGSCVNRSFLSQYSTIEYRFNLLDCNKDVYLSIPANSRGESSKGYTESLIDNKEIFVFKVEN